MSNQTLAERLAEHGLEIIEATFFRVVKPRAGFGGVWSLLHGKPGEREGEALLRGIEYGRKVEREECAAVVDDHQESLRSYSCGDLKRIATAIRARGEQP